MAMGGNDFVPMQSSMTSGMPSTAAPMGMAPKKPSMMTRRRAMNPLMAKKGGSAEKHEDAAQDRAMIKKAMAGKKFATGGVVNGQGGYKKGGLASSGIINTEDQGGEYRNTKMVTSKADRSSAKTGDVKLGNGGGYATGGVAKANGGGYKKGGATKKAYATGGVVDSGRPVAMPQGNKPIPKPVSISQLSGTYKKGGRVAPGNRALIAVSDKENATAMRQAKADSNLKYGPASKLKLKDGGEVGSSGYDKVKQTERELEEAMNPLSMIKEMGSRIKDAFTGQKNTYGPSGATPIVPKGSITKTEKSVTVAPGKKRGGCA